MPLKGLSWAAQRTLHQTEVEILHENVNKDYLWEAAIVCLFKSIDSPCCGVSSKKDHSILNNGMAADCNAPDWPVSHYIVHHEKSSPSLRCSLVSKFFDHSVFWSISSMRHHHASQIVYRHTTQPMTMFVLVTSDTKDITKPASNIAVEILPHPCQDSVVWDFRQRKSRISPLACQSRSDPAFNSTQLKPLLSRIKSHIQGGPKKWYLSYNVM